MRICHIITRLIVGGAQENTVLTCEGLHQRGHQVLLLVGPETGPEGSLHARARAGGYEVEQVDSLRRAVSPKLDWQCRGELTARLRTWTPDVVHTHSSKAGILGRLAARDARVPLIVHTVHGMSFNRTQPWPNRWLYCRLERYCARFTHQVICVADAMTRQCLENALGKPEQYRTIYSGMEIDRFDPGRYDSASVRQEWGFGADAIVVGTIARLFANKGYEQLIHAMPTAVASEDRLRFVWVGGGAWRERFEADLMRLGLRNRVHMSGLVEPNQIPRLLAGMDMLVHTSQWEGLPRAVVQAMLMERPAVSFDIDGAPEVIIPGQTGELVPLNDIDALARTLVRLAKDPDLRQRYGQAGRIACLERFDHRRMVDEIERAYKEGTARTTGDLY